MKRVQQAISSNVFFSLLLSEALTWFYGYNSLSVLKTFECKMCVFETLKIELEERISGHKSK